jgi:uncharacterized protein YggE
METLKFCISTKNLMRQILLILTLTAITSITYSQQQQSVSEIIAEGSAKMKVKPDVVVLTLTMEKRDTSEKRAVNKLNMAIDGLEKALNKIGFSNNTVRISDFDVSSSFNEQNNKKTYTATNTLKLEFQINNKLIDAIYSQIQQEGIQDLDIEFDSKLSDSLEKASRLILVQIAIEDAKTNALTIANALNIKLGRVKQVQKSALGTLLHKIEITKFTPPNIARDVEIKYRTSFDKFEIEDVELEEQITIIYTIANS